ncbi:MAG: hypothetical protein II440_07915, partial [Clostridia bacterium]|nr:hypothetical protein [Clostridia bacterium]
FTLITAEKIHNSWSVTPISTSHADTLQGKCFGYYITTNEKKAVFTGDTATLEPFEKFIDKSDELYTEIAARSGGVHLGYTDNDNYYKNKLCAYAENGIKVYLMHMDNESVISKVFSDTLVEFAPLYDR